jgi:hypothetical protein
MRSVSLRLENLSWRPTRGARSSAGGCNYFVTGAAINGRGSPISLEDCLVTTVEVGHGSQLAWPRDSSRVHSSRVKAGSVGAALGIWRPVTLIGDNAPRTRRHIMPGCVDTLSHSAHRAGFFSTDEPPSPGTAFAGLQRTRMLAARAVQLWIGQACASLPKVSLRPGRIMGIWTTAAPRSTGLRLPPQVAHGWIALHPSGAYVTFTQAGANCRNGRIA